MASNSQEREETTGFQLQKQVKITQNLEVEEEMQLVHQKEAKGANKEEQVCMHT